MAPSRSGLPTLGAGKFDPSTHTVRYFNTVAPLSANGGSSGPYSRPAVGTFSNIRRDSLYGPHLFNTDLFVAKNFDLTERVRMQLTAQAFNNHANFAGSNNCVDCTTGTPGLITDIISS